MLINLICQVSMATFNVSDITMSDVGDNSRSNPFEERGDDADQPNTKH
jgi:hypothetical protein